MTTTQNSVARRLRFHPNAYQFVFAALHHTQKMLERLPGKEQELEEAHISGAELLEGIRQFAQNQFGGMAKTVFNQWGLTETEDFGRIVFELVERGDMRKTDDDQIDDFIDIYNFEDAFHRDYEIDTSKAFS